MENIYDSFIKKLESLKVNNKATVVFLYGDLGAGKTTFTKRLVEYLGLNINITSPTFVILKNYNFPLLNFEHLIHIDAYRLDSYIDLKKIKFDEYLGDNKNLIFIEWPEKIKDGQLIADIKIFFEHGDDKENRIVSIK